jgi:hypothetical protein
MKKVEGYGRAPKPSYGAELMSSKTALSEGRWRR